MSSFSKGLYTGLIVANIFWVASVLLFAIR